MLSLNTHMYLCMYLVYSGLTTTYNLNSAKSPSHTRTTSRRSTDGSALSGGIRVRGGFGAVDGDGFSPPFALRTRGVRGSRLCQRQIWLDHLTKFFSIAYKITCKHFPKITMIIRITKFLFQGMLIN